MRRITAIEPQKYHPDRVNIYLDGEFAFGLARIVAGWLQSGQALSDEKIAGLLAEDQREMAWQRALHFLSYRARSEAEIRQNLQKHEIPETVVDETLERLRRSRLADDEQFARAWVENRTTFRPRSRRALAVELRQKGISDSAIQSVLASDMDDESLAYQAGLRKARRYASLEWPDFRKKMGGFLARRGFSYPDVSSAVKRLWDELQRGQETHSIDNEEIP